MKTPFILALLIVFHLGALASGPDSLMRALNKAIEDSRQYDDKKLAEIFNLTNILESTAANNQKARYNINLRLFEAYK